MLYTKSGYCYRINIRDYTCVDTINKMLLGVCWFHRRTKRRLLVPKTAKRFTRGQSPTKSTTALLREAHPQISCYD